VENRVACARAMLWLDPDAPHPWWHGECAAGLRCRTLKSELGVVQVCSIGGEVVGHAQIVQGQSAEEWELKSLAVQPSHRRQGIGGWLVQASLVYAREHGAKRMVVGTPTSTTSAPTSASDSGW